MGISHILGTVAISFDINGLNNNKTPPAFASRRCFYSSTNVSRVVIGKEIGNGDFVRPTRLTHESVSVSWVVQVFEFRIHYYLSSTNS